MENEVEKDVPQETKEKSFYTLKQSILKHPLKIFMFFFTVQTTAWLITTRVILSKENLLEEPTTARLTNLSIMITMCYLALTFFPVMGYITLVVNNKSGIHKLCFVRRLALLAMAGTLIIEVTVFFGLRIDCEEKKYDNLIGLFVPVFILNLLWMPLLMVLIHNMCTCKKCTTIPTKKVCSITYKNDIKSFEKGTKLTRKELCSFFPNLPNELIFVSGDVSNPLIELETDTSYFSLKARNVIVKIADDF